MLRISHLGLFAAILALAVEAHAQAVEDTVDGPGAQATGEAPEAAAVQDAAEAPSNDDAEDIADADADPLAGPDDEDAPGLLDQVVPVAETEASPAEDGSGTGAALTEQQILDEFARYQRLIAENAWDEADIAAKRVVQMAIKFYGPESIETAKALNNLAVVQHSQGQYDAAIQNFTSAVEILEDIENRLSASLVNPLKGLGAAQLGSGRPDLAASSYGRAVHITQVNEGPHNLGQVELLESLAESNMRMGEVKAANDLLERIHMINVRHFADNELGLLPSLMRRAEWQKSAGFYNDARATYRRTIRIIEDNVGNDDPRLVEPLLALAQTFYFIDPLQDTMRQQSAAISGETYFKRALRIAENAPDFPWVDLLQTRILLADYYTYTGSANRARRIYREVWDSLSEDEDSLAMRKDLLEQPVLIRENPLPVYVDGGKQAAAGTPTGDFLRGVVRVDFTVSTQGAVRELRSEVTPQEFEDMLRTVHREVRNRAFRPMHVDGEPVISPNMVFEHVFYYRDVDLEKARSALSAAQAK